MLKQEVHDAEHAVVPFTVYFTVWVVLVILTAVTVGVSYLDMKHVGVFTALLIATVKGTLVVLYFMHIRFEEWIYSIMIIVVMATYAIFIGLTFVDYWYR